MTNQQGAPEALRPEMLDDLIETFATAGLGRHNLMRVELPRHQWAQLAVALSRLHAENERLAALVEAQQPAPSAAAVEQQAGVTKWHLHLVRVIADKIEDGTLFQSGIYSNKDLARFVRNVADAAAPQPSPTPQADSAPTSVEDAETKQAGFAHSDWSFKAEVLDTSPPSAGEKFLEEPDVQDESGLNKYYSRELVLDCIEDALASKAAPQADSQPAPVRDYPPLPKPDCPNIWGGAYSKNQMRAYVDADRAARAPADSVTAPAGGEIARLRAQVETLTRDCGRQASKIAELIADLKFQDGKHREDRAQLQTIYEHQRGECWYWQGDGQDHLESLCNTLPVVIRADQLRALVTTPPAQAADSVLEDAARLLRQILAASQDGDSDTHLSAHFVSRIETITKAGGAA